MDSVNAGTPTDLLLAVGGCPNAPLLAGTWACVSSAPAWEVCLEGKNVSANCDVPIPILIPNDTRGFANNTALTCSPGVGPMCQPAVSVESASWGSIKAMYR